MTSSDQSYRPQVIEGDHENQPILADNTKASEPQSQGSAQSQTIQLALPAPGSGGTTQQPQLSGSDDVKHTISFDSLGPLVINKDGTLSRINNWAQMTDAERERIVRILGKRNMLRREAILNDDSTES